MSKILLVDFDTLKITLDLTIHTEAEPLSSDTCFCPIKYQSSHNSCNSDDNYEVDIPYLSCFNSHSNSCVATTKLVLPLEHLTLNYSLKGPHKLNISTILLPILKHVINYLSSTGLESDDEEEWCCRWDQLGRIPEDQIAIQRIVVSACLSLLSYQLSFHQCLFQFFLNQFFLHQFMETFRYFNDNDNDFFEKNIKASNLQISHQIVPVAILNFLMGWCYFQRRCVRIGVMSVP